MTENKRFVEVDRIPCPICNYPMKILGSRGNLYQCYCADCKTDRLMKMVEE